MTPPWSSLELTAKSWSTVAPGYDSLFVKLFDPWTQDAFMKLKEHNALCTNQEPQEGTGALVTCCGPGHELLPIADIMGSTCLGLDLSPGMIAIASNRIAQANRQDQVRAVVRDCMDPPPGPYRAVVSVFGLQQMPDPLLALERWVRVLAPGGVAVIIFWPSGGRSTFSMVEQEGPWARFRQLVTSKNNSSANDNTIHNSAGDNSAWYDKLVEVAERAGAKVLEDRLVQHEITWEDRTQLWEGMTRSGPWHALRLKRGDAFVDALGDEFCSIYPANEPIIHAPSARLLVLRQIGHKATK
eukprot:scaffold73105_cov49-Attheya_sp.AAC.2